VKLKPDPCLTGNLLMNGFLFIPLCSTESEQKVKAIERLAQYCCIILFLRKIYAKVSANFRSNTLSAVTSNIHIVTMFVKADLTKNSL